MLKSDAYKTHQRHIRSQASARMNERGVWDEVCLTDGEGGVSDKNRLTDGSPLFYCQTKKDITRQRMSRQKRHFDDWAAIPDSFNFSLSTWSNHQDPTADHHGRYRSIRAQLDLAYHGMYSKSRQRLQDKLLDDALGRVKGNQPSPWIIFTAGAMGSGKSHTFNWMVEQGIVPLQEVQIIDPDLFKSALPEWAGYVLRDPLTAGYKTHMESGYLVEIAQEAALRQCKHIWVDGSLRDGDWYRSEFQRIARDHPAYRIAIVHVVSRRQMVLERALGRAAVTGRHVPVSEIDDSIMRVPQSVKLLAPLTDFLALVDNSEFCPRLVRCCDREKCFPGRNEWAHISRLVAAREIDVCLSEPEEEWDAVLRQFDGDFLLRERG